jgi:hypothetical protein
VLVPELRRLFDDKRQRPLKEHQRRVRFHTFLAGTPDLVSFSCSPQSTNAADALCFDAFLLSHPARDKATASWPGHASVSRRRLPGIGD